MNIRDLFKISCKNHVLAVPSNFSGDYWRGATLGIEMKTTLDNQSLIQATIEWIIAADRSGFPFMQVKLVS
jgi:hypothetical protein